MSLKILSLIALICFSGLTTASADVYVPDDYTKIQWAVDNATIGDTVIVRDGTYYENVNVTKSVIIRSENDSSNCIVDANGSGNAFNISADKVWVEGFTLRNATGNESNMNVIRAGINVNSDESKITNNTCSENEIGIALQNSEKNRVSNNTCNSSNVSGIFLWGSNDNAITNNTLVSDGLYVANSYHNKVENNTVNGKPLAYFESTSDMEVRDAGQVVLVACNNVTVKNLDLEHTSVGIELWETNNSVIMNNSVSHTYEGITLYNSNNNTLTKNNCSATSWYGLNLANSDNNRIYLNNFLIPYFNSYNSSNIWNTASSVNYTYTYNGKTYCGYLGNYWGSYDGPDSTSDGVGIRSST